MLYLTLCIVSVISQSAYIRISALSEIQVVFSEYSFNYYVFSGRISPQEYSPSMKIYETTKGFNFSSALVYPDDRSMYGMVIDPKGQNIYIYGGLGQDGVYGDL